VDLLFANEAELKSLYHATDFDTALAMLRKDAKVAAVTRSAKGCVVVSGETTEHVPAFPVAKVEDTTGAGDLFASGFLFGIARGADFRMAGRLGTLAAAEVISHMGARPQVSLMKLAADSGLTV
jgi:adenosine kinase